MTETRELRVIIQKRYNFNKQQIEDYRNQLETKEVKASKLFQDGLNKIIAGYREKMEEDVFFLSKIDGTGTNTAKEMLDKGLVY